MRLSYTGDGGRRMASFERGSAGLLAVAIVIGGWFVGQGFAKGRARDRFVAVKGVAEREVKADLALWPLQLASTDDDLSRAQTRLNDNVQKVYKFLEANGIDASHVQLQGIRVTDM